MISENIDFKKKQELKVSTWNSHNLWVIKRARRPIGRLEFEKVFDPLKSGLSNLPFTWSAPQLNHKNESSNALFASQDSLLRSLKFKLIEFDLLGVLGLFRREKVQFESEN